MRNILLFIGLIVLAFFLIGKCSNEDTISSYYEESSSLTEPTVKEEEQSRKFEEGVVLFEQLKEKYKSRGFASFCNVKADLDSIFLISDFMAGVIVGHDNFGSARIDLAEKIEDDRVKAYCKKHNINLEELHEDNFNFALSQSDLCSVYSKMRYDSDKAEIHGPKSVQLSYEAGKKYGKH